MHGPTIQLIVSHPHGVASDRPSTDLGSRPLVFMVGPYLAKSTPTPLSRSSDKAIQGGDQRPRQWLDLNRLMRAPICLLLVPVASLTVVFQQQRLKTQTR